MFKSGFWIQSEISTDLRILLSQWIVVLSRFWARSLDFGRYEVRIVDLNVPPEISLSLFYVPDATQWRKP